MLDLAKREGLDAAAKHLGVEPDWLKDQLAYQERVNEVVDTLDESLPGLTRIIMAQDIVSGERWVERFRAGQCDAERAVSLTGSYARLDVATRLYESGDLDRDWLYREWPDLWRGSDPDDTDPRFIAIWRDVYRANGRRIVYDQRPPKGHGLPRTKRIKVYRGQVDGAPIGLSWSTDERIARKFAGGAWARTAVDNGEVIELDANRGQIMAYLTGRGEDEVIIDPATVQRT